MNMLGCAICLWTYTDYNSSLQVSDKAEHGVTAMISVLLAIALLYVTLSFLKQQKARERRIETQRDLPLEQLLPHQFRAFVEVENKLWEATPENDRTEEWDRTQIRLRGAQLQLARQYVQGLQDDFETGNRIFAVIISRSPEIKILRQLEWHRLKLEFPYYHWRTLLRFRLWTGRVSPLELRRLNEIIASLAYEVRIMLHVFEREGHIAFVESLLRNS